MARIYLAGASGDLLFTRIANIEVNFDPNTGEGSIGGNPEIRNPAVVLQASRMPKFFRVDAADQVDTDYKKEAREALKIQQAEAIKRPKALDYNGPARARIYRLKAAEEVTVTRIAGTVVCFDEDGWGHAPDGETMFADPAVLRQASRMEGFFKLVPVVETSTSAIIIAEDVVVVGQSAASAAIAPVVAENFPVYNAPEAEFITEKEPLGDIKLTGIEPPPKTKRGRPAAASANQEGK